MFIVAAFAAFPMMLIAGEGQPAIEHLRYEYAKNWSYQDSVSRVRKPPATRPQVERSRRPEPDDRIRNIQRRSIKEVPRSIPKLKPQPVRDRVDMRRPPARSRHR